MTKDKKYRIESIDILRGAVMIIMALDHTRNYFYYGLFYGDPTDLATTTPLLFFTRWITHFCAPVFVFLAGTSAFLYGTRRETTHEISWFLLTRGIWLIFLEITVVNLAWTFDLSFSLTILQVIWAIGFSMVVLGALVYLPRAALLVIGFNLVFLHNFLDPVSFQGQGALDTLWYLLHQQQMVDYRPDAAVFFAYPLIPWIGTMILGYVFGGLYRNSVHTTRRRRLLCWMGLIAIALFILLRGVNIYGDLVPWSFQETLVLTVLSFLNTTKYPPSLLYLLMTIGPSLLFLSIAENWKNKVTDMLVIVGRVPLLFYVIHLYFIHLLALIAIGFTEFYWTDFIFTAERFLSGKLAAYGFNLGVVYLVWVFVIMALYPLCKWYNDYKSAHRDKWWLSYL